MTEDVEVRQRVDVSLSVKEVTHALRCHLSHVLAKTGQVPSPASFNDISVDVSVDVDGNLLGATLTYAPNPSQHTPENHHDR